MKWNQLISNKRFGQEERHRLRHDDRSEFKRDYDRLIFSAPFRRMQNKTQVFPLPGSIFVHNRLTHSLEVASVGMSLGNDTARVIKQRRPELAGTLFEELGTIVSTACLAHDMGNPPFGHSGEKAIQAFFREGAGQKLQTHLSPDLWNDLIHFEGNANAFRLLTHRFHGRREGGFVMTYAMLASIVKYPFESHWAGTHGKFGFFCTERESFVRIATELGIRRLSAEGEPLRYARHPLVYLVEAADDICYQIMDIEILDSVSYLAFRNFLALTDKTLLLLGREIEFGSQDSLTAGSSFLCRGRFCPNLARNFFHVTISGSRKRSRPGFAFLVDIQFLTNEICSHFGHKSICHEFTAGNRNEALYSITFFMIEENDTTADVSTAWISICCHKRSDSCVSSEDSGVRKARSKFLTF